MFQKDVTLLVVIYESYLNCLMQRKRERLIVLWYLNIHFSITCSITCSIASVGQPHILQD